MENAEKNVVKLKEVVPTRRSSRLVMRQSLEELKTKAKNTEKKIRRFAKSSEMPKKKKRKDVDIPSNYEELKEKTEAGLIPQTVFYRATNNSMFIPTITADMIEDNGTNLTVTTSKKDYFKYVRVRQRTKSDHADPEQVLDIIGAVRRRPIIWDQRLQCHQNVCLVRRAWQQLDVELGLNDEYPLARRKQIWKNKKDYFSFAINSATLHKWLFASAMEFYRPMVRFRTTACLRPTVSQEDGPEKETDGDESAAFSNLLLADKTIKCTPNDTKNVMTFLLKSLHETGMANAEMMDFHCEKIAEIFEKNLKIFEKTHLRKWELSL